MWTRMPPVLVLLSGCGGAAVQAAEPQKTQAAARGTDPPAALVAPSRTRIPHASNGTAGDPEDLPLNKGKDGRPAWRAAVGDVNGDGMPDAVVAAGGDSGPGPVSVVLGNPRGGFADGDYHTWFPGKDGEPDWKSTLRRCNSQLRLADLDGDGKLEILASDYGLVQSAGNCQERGYSGVTKLTPTWSGAPIPDVRLICGVGMHDFAVVDVNHDGWEDLVVAAGGSSGIGSDYCPEASTPPVASRGPFLGIYLNKGSKSPRPYASAPDWRLAFKPQGVGVPTIVRVFDFDQDGWLDYATSFTSRATVVVFGGPELPPVAEDPLKPDNPPAGVWMSPGSPQMTTAALAMLVPDAAAPSGGPSSALLVEARACYEGHTIKTCSGASHIRGWYFTANSRQPVAKEIVAEEIFADKESVVVSLAPLDQGIPGKDAGWIAYAAGEDPQHADLYTAPIDRHVVPSLLLSDREPAPFAQSIVPFDLPRPASPEELLHVHRTADNGGKPWGPAITLPTFTSAAAREVKVGGEKWAPCDASIAERCWRFVADSNAVVLYPGAAPVGEVDVSYSVLRQQHLLWADPVGATTVGWAP